MIPTALLWLAGLALVLYGVAVGAWWLAATGVLVVGVGGYRPLGLLLWHGVVFLKEMKR